MRSGGFVSELSCARRRHEAMRAQTPPPGAASRDFLRDGLHRQRTSQAARERQSDVFKRAVAEFKDSRSPGRRSSVAPTISIALPVRPVTPRRSCRSCSPQDGESVHTSASRQPPPVEPMSRGGERRSPFVKKLEYERETYFVGNTLQKSVAAAGNVACGMRSTTPRAFQRTQVVQHTAEPASRTLGMAKEQSRRPNSGVGLAMSSPRVGVPLPASARDATKTLTVLRPLRLGHVRRPAVWANDLAEKRKQDVVASLLNRLRQREVTRVVDEWRTDGSTARQLLALGYGDDDAERLARHLDSDAQIVSFPAADRKRIEAFKSKLGEACMDRLRTLEPADVESVLQQHGFSAKDRTSLLDAIVLEE